VPIYISPLRYFEQSLGSINQNAENIVLKTENIEVTSDPSSLMEIDEHPPSPNVVSIASKSIASKS
jgi:hypothetical protein